MFKFSLILIWSSFFLNIDLIGQNTDQQIQLLNIDSLIKSLNTEKSDTQKSKTYFKIIKYYNNTEPIKALSFALGAINHSEKLNNDKFTLPIYNQVGVTYYYLGNMKTAIAYFLKILKKIEGKNDSLWISKALNNIGITYYETKDYKKSIEYLKKSLAIKINIKDTLNLWIAYQNIGMSYSKLKNYTEAIANCKLSIKAWQLTKEEKNENYANIIAEMGVEYFEMDSLDKARQLLNESYEIFEKSTNIYRKATVLIALAKIDLKTKNYWAANMHLNQTITLATQTGNAILLADAYLEKSTIEETKGNTVEALKFFKKQQAIRDSINTDRDLKEINQLNEIYLIEKQEAETISLKQELDLNKGKLKLNRIIISGAIILLLLVIIFLVYVSRNAHLRKIANNKLQEQQIIINRTVEDLQKQKEELANANSTKDKFFSIIAHDLKNPLNGMIGFSEMLGDSFDSMDTVKQKKYITIINQTSKDLYKLLENLLQWSRSQTGKIPFYPAKFNLIDAVSPIISLLNTSASNKNITIHNHIDKNTPVFADFSMVTTVIRNLLANAIKFTNVNGNIFLDYDIQGEKLTFKVRDDGIGISAENQAKIFRIDSSYSSRGTSGETGTGLGLILCKEFIEKNNGEINVSSRKGEGSTFWITLHTNEFPV